MPVNERKEHGRHRGVFYNEARGRWEQRVTLDGKRHLFSAKTAADVTAKVTEARARAERGLTPTDARRTVKAYLDWWSTEILPHSVSESTAINYRNVLKCYVLPHVGTKQLAKLAPADVTNMLTKLEQAGAAPNTRRAARSVLRRALRRAEQEGIVSRNVAAVADGVRVPAPEGRTLTPAEAKAFLQHVADDRLSAAFAVMLALGLRRGETLGLVWADIDLDASTLTVNRTLKRVGKTLALDQPKTRLSRRTLHLPAPLVEVLKAHRKRQVAEQLHAGAGWAARPLGADLVFRTPLGTATDPDNFKHRTYRLTEEAGLGRWGPHELRHSAASILLAMGVPLKVVSETLGHSSIRITADVYSHLLAPARQEAAEAAGRALWG